MITRGKYFITFAFILAGALGCKKDVNTNPNPTSTYLSASINNTFILFTPTIKVTSPEFQISGVSTGNATIQISFNATGAGTYTLGYQQATFTASTGESWETYTADTGSVVISALTANSITGTFNFTGLETRPTFGASTTSVNSGGFYLTW